MKQLYGIMLLIPLLMSTSAQQNFINIRGDPNAGTDWEVVGIDMIIVPYGNFSDVSDVVGFVAVLEILIDGEDVDNNEFDEFYGIYSMFYYTNLQKYIFINDGYVSIDYVEFVSAKVKFRNGESSPVENTTSSYYLQSSHYGIGGYYTIHNPRNMFKVYMMYALYILSTIGLLFIFVIMRSKRLRQEIFG